LLAIAARVIGKERNKEATSLFGQWITKEHEPNRTGLYLDERVARFGEVNGSMIGQEDYRYELNGIQLNLLAPMKSLSLNCHYAM
jgi:hypothetical protein